MAYPITQEVLDLFTTQHRQIVDITFNGVAETKTLTEKDVIQGGLSIDRYCVSGSRIEIGSAVAAELSLTLDNTDGKFNDTTFEGAELFINVGTKKWEARKWENAVEHFIPMGYFTVDNSPRKLSHITLSALDRMVHFDKDVEPEKLSFPMTVGNLLEQICNICNVELATDILTLINQDYVINEYPQGDDLIYRQLLMWIAEITGTCAYIDWEGKLRLEWYKTESSARIDATTHKCPVSLQFDAREALYYAETELAAGTYNFTIVTQPWYTADNGKTFQFTLTKPVPQGGQIVLDMTYNAALAGKSVKTYSGGDSTTVIETATITEGSEGTAFGKTDGSVANVNHIQRAIMGSNNYKESALRQWLNSNGAAGTFWTPQTVFDRPPSWETNTAGFINGLDADFLAVVSDTTYDVGLNNVTDGGGKETLTDKFVLLSRDEIYAGSEGGVTQGEPLPYFSEFSDHDSPSTAADSNRIKTNVSGTAVYWWLRSPGTGTASLVRYVGPSGNLGGNYAGYSYGVAPACNIIKNQ